MDRQPSSSNLRPLATEIWELAPLQQIPPGSGHGGEDYDEGWIERCWTSRLFLHRAKFTDPEIDILPQFPLVREALAELMTGTGHTELAQVMVNVLEPHASLRKHKDGPPDNPRYHLPIETNDQVVWWDEQNGDVQMRAGWWYGPVPYCGVMHSMSNNSRVGRMHLVADFLP